MIRLKEVIPFQKTADIERRLRNTYQDLDEDTFGLDIEFHTNDPKNPPTLDPYDFIEDFEYQFSRSSSRRSAQNAYEEWLEDKRGHIAQRWRGDVDRWDESYGPVDVDRWDEYHPEPELADFNTPEEYDDAHDSWETARDKVESDYDHWVSYDRDDHISDWISSVIDDGTWDSYFELPEPEDDSYRAEYEEDISAFISNAAKTKQSAEDLGWDIGKDSDDIVEIRTPPMKYTQENLNLLDEIMAYCYDNLWASGDTSAHIHIGVPKDSNIFDLLAMTTLVDEKAVKQDISADRELSEFAALADRVHKSIVSVVEKYLDSIGEKKLEQYIGKHFFVDNSKLEGFVRKQISRNSGTNIQAFFKHQTMEFRYFSSQIAPYPGKLQQWIRYFMLLPKIARSRNQFVIDKEGKFPLVFTREGKNQTKITILAKGGKMPKSAQMPSKHLRSLPPDPDKEERSLLAKLKKKLREPNQPELKFSTLP